MANIAIDIDSTLYDFETPAREACFKLWRDTGDETYKVGAYASWGSEWRAPADILGLDRWLKAISVVHDSEIIKSQVPFDGAVETCKMLMERGHTLIYITNRATETEEATREWLESYGFLPTGDHDHTLVVTTEDKRPHVSECQYIIDDRLKTVVEFVYDHDWHNVVENKVRGEWDEAEYAEELGVLIDSYFEGVILTHENFLRLNQIRGKLTTEARKRLSRKAFVKAYDYNQGGTDIPGLLIAPTWAGLSHFMVKEGLLDRAYEALRVKV